MLHRHIHESQGHSVMEVFRASITVHQHSQSASSCPCLDTISFFSDYHYPGFCSYWLGWSNGEITSEHFPAHAELSTLPLCSGLSSLLRNLTRVALSQPASHPPSLLASLPPTQKGQIPHCSHQVSFPAGVLIPQSCAWWLTAHTWTLFSSRPWLTDPLHPGVPACPWSR